MSIMKLSLAVGTVALLLSSTVNASSRYRNTNSNSGKRRRTRSAIHRDDYSDADYHRSLSSASLEGGSGQSSSQSLNYDWDIDESTSSSSFYDFEDLKENRMKKKKKKKSKRDSTEETERILLALERSSREEELGQLKRSKRKKRCRTKSNLSSSSSSSPKSSKKKRRRKREVSGIPTYGPNTPSRISRTKQKRFAKKPLAPKATLEKRKPPPSASGETASSTVASRSNPSTRDASMGRQIPQPQSHPDRTTWEVPSYSHKISTMMNNKKNESKSKPRAAAAATALPRAAAPNQDSSSRIGGVASTATTATARSARRTKPTTATSTPQSSTIGSSTTPWVRKFLAARPKDRLLPLPRDYISDNFNLSQLPPIVERIGYQAMGDNAIPVAKALQQHRMAMASSGESQPPTRSTSYPIYRRALRSILADPGAPSNDESSDEDLIIPPYAIQKAAEALYLMLHARFVISPRGLEAIRHVMALDNTVFGKCPRSCCKGAGLLPYGYSNDYTSDASVPTITTESRKEHDSCCHRYCPSCGEVWISWESKTDGCAWGPSWCHLFLLAYGSQIYANELEAAMAASQIPQPPTPVVRSFIQRGRVASATSNINSSGTTSENLSRPTPSVFGFRIHPSTDFGRPFNEASLRGGSND